jgi:hypothetical protein
MHAQGAHVLGCAGREERPALVAVQNGIPGVCGQRVNVQTGARALGAHHEPAVRRPALLPRMLEQVLLPQLGYAVVLHHRQAALCSALPDTRMLARWPAHAGQVTPSHRSSELQLPSTC